MKKIVALVLSLVMVLGLATTAFAAPDEYDFYVADKDLAVKLMLGAVDADHQTLTEVPAKANADGSGNVAYFVNENTKTGGKGYAVKATAPTVTSYAVCAAGKTDVLFYIDIVDLADVQYAATVKAFANFGTKCGQLYQVDKEEVYYEVVLGAKTSGFLPEDVVVEVNTKDPSYVGTAINVMAGDEIVTVDSKALVAGETLQPDALLKHSWAVTGVTYSASLGNVPTEAKCLNCGAIVDTFYFGATKVPAGETGKQLKAPYTAWYIVEPDFAAATPVAPSVDGEKVESAETFDAGVAMYVGMSVMAAAGSAVVLKKKD